MAMYAKMASIFSYFLVRKASNIDAWAPKNRPLHLHAVEPGNLAVISAFRQDRANRLPEQTQRRVRRRSAGAATRWWYRENFSLGG